METKNCIFEGISELSADNYYILLQKCSNIVLLFTLHSIMFALLCSLCPTLFQSLFSSSFIGGIAQNLFWLYVQGFLLVSVGENICGVGNWTCFNSTFSSLIRPQCLQYVRILKCFIKIHEGKIHKINCNNFKYAACGQMPL